MWTTEIVQIKKANGVAYVMVNFLKDGSVVAMENFVIKDSVDPLWLKRAVSNKLAALQVADTYTNGLTEGVFDPTITPETLTQAEADKRAWFALYGKYLSVKRNLVDTGLFADTTPQIAQLKADVIAGFKVAYLADM